MLVGRWVADFCCRKYFPPVVESEAAQDKAGEPAQEKTDDSAKTAEAGAEEALDDFVLLDKEEVKEAKDAEAEAKAAAPKADA